MHALESFRPETHLLFDMSDFPQTLPSSLNSTAHTHLQDAIDCYDKETIHYRTPLLPSTPNHSRIKDCMSKTVSCRVVSPQMHQQWPKMVPWTHLLDNTPAECLPRVLHHRGCHLLPPSASALGGTPRDALREGGERRRGHISCLRDPFLSRCFRSAPSFLFGTPDSLDLEVGGTPQGQHDEGNCQRKVEEEAVAGHCENSVTWRVLVLIWVPVSHFVGRDWKKQ